MAQITGKIYQKKKGAENWFPRTVVEAVLGLKSFLQNATGVSSIDSLMYFDTSNGRIGIGITTPQYNLDVAGTFRATGNSRIGGDLKVTGNISTVSLFAASLYSINTYFWSEDHDDIDCWWVGSSGVAEFHEVGARAGFYLLDPEFDEHGEDVHHTISLGGGGFLFSDRIRTPSLGIGVNAPASGIAIGNASALLTYDSTYNAIKVQPNLYSPGYISSGGVSTTSDARLKTDVKPLSLSIEQIADAPAVEFNWVGNGQRGAGSIAQYWEEQLPYNVHHNGDMLTMEYGNIALISAIVCARKIKELEEQIKKLEAKINV